MSAVKYSLLMLLALLFLCPYVYSGEAENGTDTGVQEQRTQEPSEDGAEAVDTVHDGEVYRSHDFTGVNFSGQSFVGAKFYSVDFEFSDLSKADFTGAKFNSVDFTDVNLEGACFINSKLNGVDFERVNLKGAIFTGARKVGTEFLNSNESEIIWDGPIECPNKEKPDKTADIEKKDKISKVYE